jgi:microcystin-dependent protein
MSNVILSDQNGNNSIIDISGIIIMWYGDKNKIPSGWAACNGQNTTPDLRGQFVRMYSDDLGQFNKGIYSDLSGGVFDSGDRVVLLDDINVSYDKKLTGIQEYKKVGNNIVEDNKQKRAIFKHLLGNYGGSDFKKLNIDQMPSHNHTTEFKGFARSGDVYIESIRSGLGGLNEKALFNSTEDEGIKILNTGGNKEQNNQPPYYVMTYIKKISNTKNLEPGFNNIFLSTNSGEIQNAAFPSGMIVIWAGTKQNVPIGWALCDGTKNTPDLRGQFIRMYSDDTSTVNSDINVVYDNRYAGVSITEKNKKIHQHSINDQGGTDNRILTTDELPSHDHTIKTKYQFAPELNINTIFSIKNVSQGKTNPTGLSLSQNNQPPYYVLSFIMRIEDNIESQSLLSGNNNLILVNEVGVQRTIGFPRGMIVIWSGTKENVPEGWVLCDGRNDNRSDIIIPDLRGQFVRMYSDDLNQSSRDTLSKIKVSYTKELAGISRNTNQQIRQILNHRIGDKGGTDIIVLRKDELPSHTHEITWETDVKGFSSSEQSGQSGIKTRPRPTPSIFEPNPQNYKYIEFVSSDNGKFPPLPQNNQPPYYVIAFIMKV